MSILISFQLREIKSNLSKIENLQLRYHNIVWKEMKLIYKYEEFIAFYQRKSTLSDY